MNYRAVRADMFMLCRGVKGHAGRPLDTETEPGAFCQNYFQFLFSCASLTFGYDVKHDGKYLFNIETCRIDFNGIFSLD